MRRSPIFVLAMLLLALAATGCVSTADPFEGMSRLEPDEGVIYGRIRGEILGHDIVPLTPWDDFRNITNKRRAFAYTIRLKSDDAEYDLQIPESGVFAFVVKAGTYEVHSNCYATFPPGDGDVAGVAIYEAGIAVLTQKGESGSKREHFRGESKRPLDARVPRVTIVAGQSCNYGDQAFAFVGRREEGTDDFSLHLDVQRAPDPNELRGVISQSYPELPVSE